MKNGRLIIVLVLFIFLIIGALLPANEEEVFGTAKSKFESRDYDEALVAINNAIQFDSTNSDYYELRGKILFELQDTLHSHLDFERTLSFAESDSLKGLKLKKLIDWDAQHDKEDLKRLLSEEAKLFQSAPSKHAELLEYTADKYLHIGDTMTALKLFKELSKSKPSGRIFNKIGMLYGHLKQNRKAISVFKQAVDTEPNNNTFLYNLGVAYLNIKNKTKAKHYFKLSMNNGNKYACNEYRELSARIRYSQRSRCCDGTISYSFGRGTCSHHGGVCRIENIPYKEYQVNCK